MEQIVYTLQPLNINTKAGNAMDDSHLNRLMGFKLLVVCVGLVGEFPFLEQMSLAFLRSTLYHYRGKRKPTLKCPPSFTFTLLHHGDLQESSTNRQLYTYNFLG